MAWRGEGEGLGRGELGGGGRSAAAGGRRARRSKSASQTLQQSPELGRRRRRLRRRRRRPRRRDNRPHARPWPRVRRCAWQLCQSAGRTRWGAGGGRGCGRLRGEILTELEARSRGGLGEYLDCELFQNSVSGNTSRRCTLDWRRSRNLKTPDDIRVTFQQPSQFSFSESRGSNLGRQTNTDICIY